MASKRSLTRVFIADKHPIFRDAVKTALSREFELSVIGETGKGDGTLQLVSQQKPDVLLLDPAMPKTLWMELLKALAESQSGVKTIILGNSASQEEISGFFESGAHGFVAKESAFSVLKSGIKAVMAGKYWIGNKAVSRPGDRFIKYNKSTNTSDTENYGLTDREMQVMGAVVSGYTNKEIAAKLRISEQTVKHHITNIFDKLGVYNRLELALFVFHHGLEGN